MEQSVPNNLRLSRVVAASPHTSSTPNINSVRHADSRGSLVSTDSTHSLSEKNHDKSNSLDKVLFVFFKKTLFTLPNCRFIVNTVNYKKIK